MHGAFMNVAGLTALATATAADVATDDRTLLLTNEGHAREVAGKWRGGISALGRALLQLQGPQHTTLADKGISLLKEVDSGTCHFVFWDSAEKKVGRKLSIDKGRVVYAPPHTRTDFNNVLADGRARVLIADVGA
eukprot:9892774-Alexandrium_andersonii.AAC.1